MLNPNETDPEVLWEEIKRLRDHPVISPQAALSTQEDAKYDPLAAIRLRGLLADLNLPDTFPGEDAKLMEVLFSILGTIRDAIARLRDEDEVQRRFAQQGVDRLAKQKELK